MCTDAAVLKIAANKIIYYIFFYFSVKILELSCHNVFILQGHVEISSVVLLSLLYLCVCLLVSK